MTHALLWKEYRTQRMAWGALAFLGAVALLGLPPLMAPNGYADHPDLRLTLRFLAGALAWTYGLVCGAMLLAGERELRTLPFLDMLPGYRRQIWLAKLLGGALLTAAQIVVLLALAAGAGLFEGVGQATSTLFGMAVAGLYGLAWGMLFSAFGRSVMNMILLALAAQVAAAFLTAMFAALFGSFVVLTLNGPPAEGEAIESVVVGLVALLTVPLCLAVSALRFTRPDRGRLQRSAAPAAVRTGKPRVAWSALCWLTWRQGRGFAAGMAVFALLLGLLTLAQGVTLWPAATLLVGVLCGATAFADEQQGPFRLLGDQRFPLGKLWIVKVGFRFAVAVAAALVVLAPSFFAAFVRASELAGRGSDGPIPFFALVFQSNLLGTVVPAHVFLTVWLFTGFAAGVLCGLLLRNGLAAGVFALGLAVLMSVVWAPSLLQGGLHFWQVIGAPALLLASTFPLLRPWAAGRTASWTTVRRLAPCVVLALLWEAGGVWYRVLEIPNAPQKYDVDAFRAGLPTPEQNQAGDLVRRACAQFGEQYQKLEAAEQAAAAGMAPAAGPAAPGMPAGGAPVPMMPPAGVPGAAAAPAKPGPPGAMGLAGTPPKSVIERAQEVVQNGWKGDDPELAAWLDKLSGGEWRPLLHEAAGLPPGMVEDLRNVTLQSGLRFVEPAQRMAVVLAARGLQRQAAGDDEAFVESLRDGLTLARSLRHHAPMYDVLAGRGMEVHFLAGVNTWLGKLKGRPDLMRQALDLLSAYLRGTEADEADQQLVNYLIARNTLDYPVPWFYDYLSDYPERVPTGRDDVARTEAHWMFLAGLVPWEHGRQERLLRFLFSDADAGGRAMLYRYRDVSPVTMLAVQGGADDRFRVQPSLLCEERAAELRLALRRYQAETGRPAETLDDLVPKYLTAVPLDPYDDKPFRYRLSRGEQIEWPSNPEAPVPQQTTRTVPPGQGVLWSVGPDKQDDGGKRQNGYDGNYNGRGVDVIYLVPLPPQEK